MGERIHPSIVVRHYVRNQSHRNGPIRAIILHSTEGTNRPGIGDLVGLGNWFDNPGAQASSHVGVDQDGHSARYVPDVRKAWTQANYNSSCLSIEAIGFASENWAGKSKQAQRREMARWIALWSKAYKIPLRYGKASSGVIVKSGVLQHRDLGVSGGGHHDISPRLPMGNILRYAAMCRARL
jgi:hypothetical protein